MRFEYLKRPIDQLLAGFTILVMSMLVGCVVWQVFSRYVLQQPSTSTDELARFSMIWVGLLGAAYALGQKRHLCIDLFTTNLRGRKQFIQRLLADSCILLFAASTMIWGGGVLVLKVWTTGQISPALQMPMAYVYAVLPLSGLLMVYYSLLSLLDTLLQGWSPATAVVLNEENA